MKIAKSIRRPQRIYSFVMWVLSVLFAAMLIGLGSLIIADLPKAESTVSIEQFVDEEKLAALNRQIAENDRKAEAASEAVRTSADAYETAKASYEAARQNLNAWLETRSATEENAQNPQVLERTRIVEALQAQQRNALAVAQEAQRQRSELSYARIKLTDQLNELYKDAQPELDKAFDAKSLRVFGYRLALTLPLLLVAGYFVARKRGSSYWPLYRGFVLFALFAFFVELVPYLPSYGGYVRYLVGVLLLLIVGHYLIKSMRSYLERKQAEEQRSEKERRQSIGYETALKKISAETCPGCDRPIQKRDGELADYCVHCGIQLHRACNACGTRNISFHHFCLECGTPLEGVSDTAINTDPAAHPA